MAAILQTQMHLRQWKSSYLIQVSHKYIPEGPIHNISALVQMMARRRIGDGIVYPRIYASLGLNYSNVLGHE